MPGCRYRVIMVWVNIVRSRYIINVVLHITCNNNIVLNYFIINPDLWWYWLLPISGGGQTVNNRSAKVIWEIVCKRMLCIIILSLPCASYHPSFIRNRPDKSTWQFLHLLHWLINWFQHSSSCPAFQTDLIITSLARIDVLVSMMVISTLAAWVTRLPCPDDWSLALHCYIRQLNNWCNNRHTVFVSTKY